MMEDAAAALADLLEQWRVVPPGATAEGVRELGDPATDVMFWSHHARALDLVREVERALGMLEQNGRPTSHYRRHLPAIYGAIGGYTVPFRSTTSQGRHIIDENAIGQLRSLSDVLHAMNVGVPDSEDLRATVGESIGIVRSLLTDYPDLDRESRGYLLALATELEQALNDADVFGTALMRRVSTELAGVLFGQAVKDAKDNPTRAQRFWGAALKLFWVGATAATTKAIDVGADEFVKQLGTGGN
ncbi:hypothetical protein QSU92_07705 [Microbacterium sp. ET2]|uniref:hypothetical protein n=1 Tax=Microbacterium albipurpureum TaxID=3050384 RepID=UPI00259CFD79|nr:hypothetical protein [Microbacterium sp. ET2 (Ac-2212)]WJL97041.1 hypothetical protein QSU92_07705 [Microbacterium sp. ET2 (Ac-2212)]